MAQSHKIMDTWAEQSRAAVGILTNGRYGDDIFISFLLLLLAYSSSLCSAAAVQPYVLVPWHLLCPSVIALESV